MHLFLQYQNICDFIIIFLVVIKYFFTYSQVILRLKNSDQKLELQILFLIQCKGESNV